MKVIVNEPFKIVRAIFDEQKDEIVLQTFLLTGPTFNVEMVQQRLTLKQYYDLDEFVHDVEERRRVGR